MHKRSSNVRGMPLISNCIPAKKVSKGLDNQLQSIMRKGASDVKDSRDFINKIRKMGSVPDNAIWLTADVTALCL